MVGTSTLKEPSLCTVADKVCILPALSVTVIETVLPAGWSVVPLMVGVASLPTPGSATSIAGDVVSTTPPVSESEPVFPAPSVTSATTV